MLLKDFINNSIYRWTNQKLPSYLLWTNAVVNCVNYGLSDIYTYEGKFRTFMYDEIVFDTTTNFTDDDKLVYIDVPYPLLRVAYIEDLSWQVDTFETKNIKPSTLSANTLLMDGEIYYKQHTKRIRLKNNRNKYIIHYIHHFDYVTYSDTAQLPVPDIFLGALYQLTMGYIYPSYWQQWENKENNAWQKWRQSLTDLAKTDSMQLTWIQYNIK